MHSPSHWLTKPEVCTALGLSLSQVNNLVKQGRLEVRMEPRLGLSPIGKVNPRDVEREKGLRTAKPVEAHVMPSSVPAAPPAAPVLPQRHLLMASLLPLWLRVEEAVLFSGLGPERLRALAREGTIRGEQGPRGCLVVNRYDLEMFANGRRKAIP